MEKLNVDDKNSYQAGSRISKAIDREGGEKAHVGYQYVGEKNEIAKKKDLEAGSETRDGGDGRESDLGSLKGNSGGGKSGDGLGGDLLGMAYWGGLPQKKKHN